MRVALDYNDERILIDETKSNQEYYCPFCGQPLITKKGDIRQHHFAHKSSHPCSDSWERDGMYDLSDWHNTWQDEFPPKNQEVKVQLGMISHRADVMVGRTVVEFQRSSISTKAFHDRNEFYFNLGYKVVWLFDMSGLYQSGQLTYIQQEDDLTFTWENPKKAFSSYDVLCGCIDLFFQLSDDKNSIVRVKDVSERGFESFKTSSVLDKQQFLEYIGRKNGIYPLPMVDNTVTNESYQRFKEKYNIVLNPQQERAVQAVEGHNLLLAVPGSGKTTVLVARLGYMIFERGIAPESILAITFNKNAAEEMKTRFHQKFGKNAGGKIRFCTLNSLAYSIYTDYCKQIGDPIRKLISEQEVRFILKKIYHEIHPDDYADESTVQELLTEISSIKNMMLELSEILKMGESVSEVYKAYDIELKKQKKMDFNDQLVYAHRILLNDKDILNKLQAQYQYICVDEAQDTSKIQHAIISCISSPNNLFMVGDEDQSIYGFRAAYPKALLNFRYDYKNPYIMRMERNYRSTPQIVQQAQHFISQNKGRYEKNMTAERADGVPVQKIDVPSRTAQFKALLDIAKERNSETAFLYRDNESAVVLIDLFLRNGIPFKLKKPKMNFWGNRTVKESLAYLRLSLNPFDIESFEAICNKGILYIKEKQKKWAGENCKRKNISIYEALQEQMKYVSAQYKNRAADFESIMNEVARLKSSDALELISQIGYEQYLLDNHLDGGKFEIVKALAEQEPDKRAFLKRMEELEDSMQLEHISSEDNPVILSTIHSSKGLEYDTVYMVDVYDGRFPTSIPNPVFRSKDNLTEEQEERRLFYVGITRAKNRLFIMNIQDKTSQYISELFPLNKSISTIKQVKDISAEFDLLFEGPSEVQLLHALTEHIPIEKDSTQRCEKERDPLQDLELRRQEVQDKFTQQQERIFDHTGQRWVKCERCGKIKPDSEFAIYGGENHINLGTCSECSRKLAKKT